MSTLANLVAELRTRYTELEFVSPKVNPEEIVRPGVSNPKLYHFHYLEFGLSEKEAKPVARETKKAIYVYNLGEVDEAAYYDGDGPQNEVDRSTVALIPALPTLREVSSVFLSKKLQARVLGALLTAANAWFWTDSRDANFSKIMKLVSEIRRNSQLYICDVMGHLCVRSDVLGDTITDSTIQNEVNGLKDKWIVSDNV